MTRQWQQIPLNGAKKDSNANKLKQQYLSSAICLRTTRALKKITTAEETKGDYRSLLARLENRLPVFLIVVICSPTCEQTEKKKRKNVCMTVFIHDFTGRMKACVYKIARCTRQD